MLPAPNRLKKSRAISRVFARGRYGVSEGLLIKTLPNGSGQSRLVVVVSKKISKKAVVRNRLRRRISGDLEPRWATVTPGYDIVISVRSDLSMLTPAQLTSRLNTALSKAGLTKK